MNNNKQKSRLFENSKQIKDVIEALVLPNKYSINKISTQSVNENHLLTYTNSTNKITRIDVLYLDIKNQINVWDFLLENDHEYDENFVFTIHAILSAHLNIPIFEYRKFDTKLSGTTYKPSEFIDDSIVNDFLKILNNQDPIEIALFIMKNQMFENTNKRTGYYVMAGLFLKEKLILQINKENHQEYIDAITHYYETNDDKWFRRFVNENLRKLDLNLKEIKEYKNTRIKNSLSR